MYQTHQRNAKVRKSKPKMHQLEYQLSDGSLNLTHISVDVFSIFRVLCAAYRKRCRHTLAAAFSYMGGSRQYMYENAFTSITNSLLFLFSRHLLARSHRKH